MTSPFRIAVFRLLCAVALLLCGTRARADDFSTYAAIAPFSFPGETVAFDTLPDGRLITAVGADIYRETASGSRAFTHLGALPNADLSGFGAAFLRVSPGGSTIAVGNNGGASFGNYQVGIFDIATLTGQWFVANHYDGAWLDDRYVALTAGALSDPTSIVTALDTLSPTPANPRNPTIITNIGGASAGVAIDANGNLFTGNGYMYGGPSQTGYIYAFRSSLWSPALSGGAPANFETQGIPIVDLLSAGTLAFDGRGNLLVGGGDGFGSNDSNYFALVRASAIATALVGGGLIDTSAAAGNVRRFDPDPSDGTFYTVNVNRVRKEIYGTGFGSETVYAYKAAASAVPATPSWSVALMVFALVFVGLSRGRSRSQRPPALTDLGYGSCRGQKGFLFLQRR
ncbi:MAG TPA: hypothetical protein VHC69_30485 [Polyangiaceae bacterium]|nr:hypothetical protein [Polyangiaceae bacterium]